MSAIGVQKSEHGGTCDGTWCDFCGCCEHGPDDEGCRVAEAPVGMSCPGYGCWCEGEGFYVAPVPPEFAAEPIDDSNRQLHQETALFDIEVTR